MSYNTRDTNWFNKLTCKIKIFQIVFFFFKRHIFVLCSASFSINPHPPHQTPPTVTQLQSLHLLASPSSHTMTPTLPSRHSPIGGMIGVDYEMTLK